TAAYPAATTAAFDYDAHHIRAHPTGDTVARAKRTERAAARRRYRATTEPELVETEAEEEREAPAPRRAVAPPRPSGDTGRVGIGAALRSSFRPLRVREDLAMLPSLVRHRSLWLPVAVTVGGAGVVALAGIGEGSALGVVGVLLFQYFLFPPALGGPFLVGFLAPRASWLLGVIVGLVAASCYSILILAFSVQITTATPDAAQIQTAAISSFFLSPIMGGLFAALAAWYRRFLSATNPNRGRRTQQPQKRVGDGRTRASSGQKPNAKAPARR
ncbi:MAG TPA: hypothetical protein VFW02_03950, partial [Candidatus Limnocylindrales bacterium]|nr:hypothetical protein [Candidatus Limnocylindrales bacterium]